MKNRLNRQLAVRALPLPFNGKMNIIKMIRYSNGKAYDAQLSWMMQNKLHSLRASGFSEYDATANVLSYFWRRIGAM